MKIKFWGTRGSIPVPDSRMMKYGGNTTCVEVRINDHLLIIDTGTGIRRLGEELVKRKESEINLFITHSHWDHIQGFPFFIPVYLDSSHINVIGYKRSYKQIKDSLSNQMSLEYFPVRFDDLSSNISFTELKKDMWEFAGHVVKIIKTNHTVFTLAIRIEKGNNSFVFITDNELESRNPITTWDQFVDFAKDATYMIHDAQFTLAEYDNRVGWGHSTYDYVVELAKAANVKNVGFTHHDPDRKDFELEDIEKYYQHFCKINKYPFNVFAVKEMQEIDLTPLSQK